MVYIAYLAEQKGEPMIGLALIVLFLIFVGGLLSLGSILFRKECHASKREVIVNFLTGIGMLALGVILILLWRPEFL